MDLRDLRYFTAVARSGSLTAAAQLVNVSQPALSYQLKQLEAELGLQLLVRLPRGVAVTEAGEVLLARASALLDDFAAIKPALAPFKESATTLISVGMSPTPARALASDLIEAFAASSTSISIQEGFSDDLLEMVRSAKIDCALCYVAPGQDQNLRTFPLVDEELFAVGQPGTFAGIEGPTITFVEMAKLPLVLDSTHQASRRLVDTLAKELDVTLDTVSVTSVTVKRELLSKSKLCTVVPFGLYAAEIDAGLLDARRVVDPPIKRRLSLVHTAGNEASLSGLSRTLKLLVQRYVDEGHMRWTGVPD